MKNDEPPPREMGQLLTCWSFVGSCLLVGVFPFREGVVRDWQFLVLGTVLLGLGFSKSFFARRCEQVFLLVTVILCYVFASEVVWSISFLGKTLAFQVAKTALVAVGIRLLIQSTSLELIRVDELLAITIPLVCAFPLALILHRYYPIDVLDLVSALLLSFIEIMLLLKIAAKAASYLVWRPSQQKMLGTILVLVAILNWGLTLGASE